MKKTMVLLLLPLCVSAMRKPQAAQKTSINQKMQDELVAAVGKNDIQKVQRLLRFRPQVEVNTTDSHGDRPLEVAVRIRNAQMVQLLLKNGANPNLRMSSGMTPGKTPLMYAVSLGDADTVELLLTYGADPGATFNDNRAQGGKDRKAIDFLSAGPNYERIKSMLTKTKLP